MNRRLTSPYDGSLKWILRYNRPIIVFLAFFLLFFEIIEPIIKHESITDFFHVFEIIFYFALLILVRVLIDYLSKAYASQNHTMELLRYKHDISLEFAKIDSWDMLINELVRLPGKITEVAATRLQIHNPVSGRLEEEASWYAEGMATVSWSLDHHKCIEQRLRSEPSSNLCVYGSDDTEVQDHLREFCIPVNRGNKLIALIQVKQNADRILSPEQIEIFENIIPEIASALKASQEHETLKEMENTRTALTERRIVSTFIHDQLGQNLGYLHFNLDKLSRDKKVEECTELQKELNHLRDVANDSYEIVRDVLKKLQSETVPHLSNLLREQAATVAQRANFSLNFEVKGKPVPLLPAFRQAVFFTFCEVLRNIEKHAGASHVDVCVSWNEGMLDISVSDNGIGFDPGWVDGREHFGLQIMRERIENIKGTFTMSSSADAGTDISMSIPVKSIMAVSK